MSLAGKWNVTIKSPMGDMNGVWVFDQNADGTWGGTNTAMGNTDPWDSVTVDGNKFNTAYTMNSPMGKMSGTVQGVLSADGSTITGLNASSMGVTEFSGVKA